MAHRGYASKFPENTLLAMAEAVRAGALFLECDIQLTSDNIPVLHHDASLARSAGSLGTVMERSFEELSRLGFGEPFRFGAAFKGTPITPLADMVKLLSENPAVCLFVELKEESLDRFGVGTNVGAVIEVIRPVMERCIAISFATAPLAEARRHGWKKTGWVVDQWDDISRKTAESLSPDYLFCDYEIVPPEPDSLWKGDWKWVLYEIADPDLAEKWFGLGADMVETMRIGEMIAAFRGKDVK